VGGRWAIQPSERHFLSVIFEYPWMTASRAAAALLGSFGFHSPANPLRLGDLS
jgi:hypothetical protein